MKNYKIIENRSELNFTQIEQGMDFTAIKSKAALTSKTTAVVWSTKTIIINSIAGTILVSGTIFGIKQYNKEPNPGEKMGNLVIQAQKPKATEQIKTDSAIFVEEPIAEKAISTPTKTPVKAISVASIAISNSTAASNTLQLESSSTNVANSTQSNTIEPISITQSVTSISKIKEIPFRQSDNATFTFIELTTHDCFALSKESSPTGITGMDCALGCEFKYIDCDALSQIPYIRVVRLTITEPKAKLVLKSNFENIKLLHGNKTTHPLAIYLGYTDPETKQPRFLHKKFKSKGAVLKTENRVEIIMIIEEPIEVGDKLIFDNLRAVLLEK